MLDWRCNFSQVYDDFNGKFSSFLFFRFVYEISVMSFKTSDFCELVISCIIPMLE